MGFLFRLLSMLGSARNARQMVSSARDSVGQIKSTAEGFRSAAFQRTWDRAGQGDVEAQHDLGEYYYDGRVVPQDYSEALGWFLKAAESGHGKSQFSAGLMLCLGRGAERDLDKACLWLSRAAEQGVEGAEAALAKARERAGS